MASIYRNVDNIDSDTTFDEVWVGISLQQQIVRYITAINEGEIAGRVETISRREGSAVDPTHESYEIARDAVVAGTATLKYYFGGNIIPRSNYSAYEKDDVPLERRHWLRYDTFSEDVQSQEQQVEDVRWSELTFFRYDDATDIAVPVPSLEDGDVDGLIEDMETGGWYQLISTAYTNRGTNTTLRTAVVSYEYVGNTDTATVNVNVVPANKLRYSINGIDFTDNPPSDESTITHIEWTVSGEVIDIRIKPETELVNPVENLINQTFPPYENNPTSPSSASFSGADFNRLYAIQHHVWDAPSWSNAQAKDFSGFSELQPINELMLTSPQLIGQDDFSGHDEQIEGGGSYYVLLFGRTNDVGTGVVKIFHVDSDDINVYGSDYMAFLFCYESYPVTTLHNAVPNTAAASVRIFGTGRGISDGDTLFVNDEEMEVTGMSASQLIGSDVTTLIAVDRGVNDTTAAAHSVGDTIRAVLNSDRIRNLVFLRGHNSNPPVGIRILGYKRPLEVV